MIINPHMFRGYDLRGIVDKDLNPEIVEHIGKAFGTFLKRKNIQNAVVGYDCRQTSPEYTKAIIQGLTWAGINVINIGLNMVGTFYWAQYHLNTKGGVFVTASHNPANYNGFKFADNFSETLVSEGIQTLRKMVEEDDIEEAQIKGTVEKLDIKHKYFQELKSKIHFTKKFKVVIDPSCTTAGVIVPELLKQFNCEVVENNCNIDPTFPLGTPDPTEEKIAKRLAQKILETNSDLGFSYDADGDRIGIVDEKGRIIWNDVLVALFSIDVLHDHPGSTIIFNALCSQVVYQTIKNNGGIPFMWRTGHSFLKHKNKEVKAAFMGELSGHFFFSTDFYNHDDGCYATLRLLKYLSRTNQTLSEAVEKLPKFISSPEIKVGCPDEVKISLMQTIANKLREDFPKAKVLDDESVGDGVRLEKEGDMFIVRYSQNGPYITIKFESKTKEKYEALRKYLNQLLHSYPEIIWEGQNTINKKALESF